VSDRPLGVLPFAQGNSGMSALASLVEGDTDPMFLRAAQPADAIAVAKVHVRSWQIAYRGLLPDEYLDGLRPEDRAQSYTFGDPDPLLPASLVAVEGRAICGFATTGPSRDEDRLGTGELLALYVDPDRWGVGIGRALIQEARARLAQQGFVGNERADRFYRLDGWLPDGSRREDAMWGVSVEDTRFCRSLP
jgi:GNAT superfamily N-acetyltransferase